MISMRCDVSPYRACPAENKSKTREAEAYQQTVRQKEQEITKLNNQLQELIKKQMSSPVPSLSVDRSVIEVSKELSTLRNRPTFQGKSGSDSIQSWKRLERVRERK